MSQLPHPWGLNHFIFFNAHFLSVNIFQGEGGVVNELLYIAGVGINPGKQNMYHMCKTWLQKVHSGWDMGGDLEIKIYK